MVIYTHYVFIFILGVKQCELCENAENSILIQLIQQLNIHNVVIMTNNIESSTNMKDIKQFSTRFMPGRVENSANAEKLVIEKPVSYGNTALIFKRNELEILNIFKNLAQIDMLHQASGFIWIIFMNTCPTDASAKFYNVPYDCLFVIVCPKNSTTYQLLETFQVKNVTSILEFGAYENRSGLEISNKFFYNRRLNFNGTELLLSSQYPENMCIIRMTCVLLEYLNYLSAKLNFKYRLLPGRVAAEEIYTSKEADFYHELFIFHSDFEPDIKIMITPFFIIKIDWFIKYPEIQEEGNYIRPFHRNLWITICLTISTGSLIILFLTYLKQKFGSHEEPFSYVDCTFVTFECFLNQDGTKDLPFKIVVYMLRLAAIFILTAYSARIISFLALGTPDIPFKNLDQFIKKGDYSVAKTPGTISEFFLEGSSNSLIQLVNEKFSRILKNEEIPDAICKEKVAAIMLSPFILDRKCYLLKLEKPLDTIRTAMRLPRNSSFAKISNYLLITFHTSGIFRRHQSQEEAEFREKKITDDYIHAVELTNIIQILFIIPIGIVLATTFLFCEIITKRFTSRKIINKY